MRNQGCIESLSILLKRGKKTPAKQMEASHLERMPILTDWFAAHIIHTSFTESYCIHLVALVYCLGAET